MPEVVFASIIARVSSLIVYHLARIISYFMSETIATDSIVVSRVISL